MSKLIYETMKFFGKSAKNIMNYAYATRVDTRKGHGLLHSLLTGKVNRESGARFSTEKEQLKIFPHRAKGLLIDGERKRLSLEDSFKHVLLVAQTGAGKTTKYIIPNVLQLADSNNSIIVTDPSGEIFSQTSGYMQSKGFKVLKFDPTDPSQSIYYNPLRFVFRYSNGRAEIDQIKLNLVATSLVASVLTGSDDAYWRIGAEDLIEFFTLCLKHAPMDCHNLYNVYRLLEAMSPTGEQLFTFMDEHLREQKLMDKWLGYIGSEGKSLSSHLASARMALKALGNTHIAKMTSRNSFRFADFKKEKTILYLTFPVNEASYYTFLINLFYTQLFHDYMSALPQKEDLPLFILYDEFGHANIPNFDMVATNIRKYRVSLSLVLQSFSQLEKQYGHHSAKTIIEGGVNSKLFFAGASLDTANSIEHLLGKVVREEFSLSSDTGGYSHRNEYNLLNSDEIRTLPEHQAFFITGNKNPILLDVTAVYHHRKFKDKFRFGEAFITPNQFHRFALRCILDEKM